MVHPLKDQPKVLLVHPVGVTLLEYDELGRLRKSRTGKGDYCLYDYGRDGWLKKLETFTGSVKLTHTKEGLLSSCKLSTGCAGKFAYGDNGVLQRLVVDGLAGDIMANLAGVLGFFWQWFALKGALRLVAQLVPEKGGGS